MSRAGFNPKPGEPYGQIKRKARHLLASGAFDDEELSGQALRRTLERLIETAPKQALDALCDVAEANGV